MNELSFRQVNPDDVDLIYEWANDKDTRAASFNSEPIIYENHVAWFNKKLDDVNTIFCILMDDDIPVGSVRLELLKKDDSSTEYQINYQIAPNMRNKGYGKKMISLLPKLLSKKCMLIAEVKDTNLSSAKCFRDNGYKESKCGEELRFTLDVI